ncbi:MAG: VanW family protein [Candidatus Doudnabacteria bacterium]|nr:VanW family protein [Candidatus Doudnabacteria bacterium]
MKTPLISPPQRQGGVGNLMRRSILSLGGVLAAVGFLLPAPPLTADDLPPPRIEKRNFGFMKKTQSWASDTLLLNFENDTYELREQIPLWHQSQTIKLSPRPHPPLAASYQSINDLLVSFGLQNPWTAFLTNEPVLGFDLDEQEIYDYLNRQVAIKINRSPQDARLVIANGRAGDFQPSLVGQSLDLPKTISTIKQSLFTNQSISSLSVATVPPRIKLSETNALGINELVARGESDFAGSSQSRIHNIRKGAERFTGLILKPGEEFSFNQYLGPVTKDAGFKPELVIKSVGTVPELGGGLCQVSTTVFRAALYGGLPVTARKNHSYAVKYYAPQGTDATIYPGVVDLKFLNDTPAHLLINTRLEGTKLYFEFYGTGDQRSVVIEGPFQYDKQPNGAMKARLKRIVTKPGEKTTDDFFSKYVPKELFPTIYEYPSAQPVSPNQTNQGTAENQTPPTQ